MKTDGEKISEKYPTSQPIKKKVLTMHTVWNILAKMNGPKKIPLSTLIPLKEASPRLKFWYNTVRNMAQTFALMQRILLETRRSMFVRMLKARSKDTRHLKLPHQNNIITRVHCFWAYTLFYKTITEGINCSTDSQTFYLICLFFNSY